MKRPTRINRKPVTARSAGRFVAWAAPAPFTLGQWALDDVPSAGGNTLGITLSAIPAGTTSVWVSINGAGAVLLTGSPATGIQYPITVPATTLASVRIFAVNFAGSSAPSDAKTRTPTVVAAGPTNTVLPLITGVNLPSQTLTVSNGTWSEAVTVARVWKLDGVATGGTGATITSDAGSAGKVYTCDITATGASGSTTVTTLPFGIQTSVTVAPAAALATFNYAAGSPDWVNTANAVNPDAAAATCDVTLANTPSRYLSLSLAATSIPANARIDGVRISLDASASSGMRVARIYLTDAAGNQPSGTPVADDSVVIQAVATTTWGGPNEDFGLTLTPQGFNSGAVGIAMSFKITVNGLRTVSVRGVSVEVFYTPGMGNATLPQVSVATAMLRNSQTGNTSRLHRIFFPGETRTPVGVLFMSNDFSATQFPNGTVGTGKQASSLAKFFGAATPTRQGSIERILNGNDFSLGFSPTATIHLDRAIPADMAGAGATNNYTFGNSGSQRFKVEAWGPGYVDVLGTIAPGNADLIVHFQAFFGVQMHLEMREGFARNGSETSRTVTCGFEPQVMLGISQDLQETAAHGAYWFIGLGVGLRVGSTWSQWAANHTIATKYYNSALIGNQSPFPNTWQTVTLETGKLCININTNDPQVESVAAANLPYGLTYRHGVIASSATGYTYGPVDGVPFLSPSEDAYMTVAIAGLTNVAAGFATSPATTGRAVLATGFRTQAALLFNTLATSVARVNDVTDQADGSSLTMIGARDVYSQGVNVPGNSVPMDASGFIHNGLMVRSGTNTTPVDRIVATLEQHGPNGPVLNYSVADATPRQLMYLAFG
jgi:hypothetical protein